MGILKTDDAWTGKDKNLHLGLMAIGTFVAFAVFGPVVGSALAVAVVVGKEYVYDYRMKKGTPSLQDLVVSLAGAVIGGGLNLLIT